MDTLRLMAGTPSRNFEEIDRLLSCPICLEVFSKPVVILPCQHNLCRKCANDVFQNRGTPMGSGGRFRCPTCRYEVVLDRHGVYGLQRNLLVENIIDIYQSEERNHGFKKVETLMCEDHEEEKVNIYCVTCQKPTCSLCKVFGQHQECEVAPVERIYKEQKKEMSDGIAMLVSGNDRLQAIIAHTQELCGITESNSQQIKAELCSAFDHLYSVLEERKTIMMARITADVQERKQTLQDMIKSYGQRLEQASNLMESSLTLLEERNAPQFLSISREMIEKVVESAKSSEVKKPPFDIQNMEEFHVDFNFQKEILTKLDFRETKEEKQKFELNNLQANPDEQEAESELDEECDVPIDIDAIESDEAANTSVASRSESVLSIAGKTQSEVTGTSYSRDNCKVTFSTPSEGASGSSSRNSNRTEENQEWRLW